MEKQAVMEKKVVVEKFSPRIVREGVRNRQKTLKEKSSSANEANILAGQISESSSAPVLTPPKDAEKENQESLSQARSENKKGKGATQKSWKSSYSANKGRPSPGRAIYSA
ncbi:hypothetical protein AAG906_017516 [Vitis piasezkii]